MPPLRPGKRHVIKGSLLTIHKTKRNDGGVYVCRVTSKFGVIYDGLLLTIRTVGTYELFLDSNLISFPGLSKAARFFTLLAL